MPSSETTQLTKLFVKDIEIKDIRFDLTWAFGDVLKEVPQRLGSDPAFDSAAKTFTTVIPFARSGKCTEHMIRTYVNGLQSMSIALSKRSGSCKGNVWMMIYLTCICQVHAKLVHL